MVERVTAKIRINTLIRKKYFAISNYCISTSRFMADCDQFKQNFGFFPHLGNSRASGAPGSGSPAQPLQIAVT
jgi:hypothetical protein